MKDFLEPARAPCPVCGETVSGARDTTNDVFLPKRGLGHLVGCAYWENANDEITRAVDSMVPNVTIERRLLQIVFDTAINSLDFGSGHLDDEEVTGLRAIAEVLGVDPLTATPDNFKCKYTGQHTFLTSQPDWCWRCRQTIARAT